jgi:hypothetical protein
VDLPTSRVFRRLHVPDVSPSSPSPRHSLPHHPFSSTTSNARHFLYATLALDLSSPVLASSLPPTSALALPPTTTLEHARPFSPSPPLPTPPSCRWLVDLARRLLLGWAVLSPPQPSASSSQLAIAHHTHRDHLLLLLSTTITTPLPSLPPHRDTSLLPPTTARATSPHIALACVASSYRSCSRLRSNSLFLRVQIHRLHHHPSRPPQLPLRQHSSTTSSHHATPTRRRPPPIHPSLAPSATTTRPNRHSLLPRHPLGYSSPLRAQGHAHPSSWFAAFAPARLSHIG